MRRLTGVLVVVLACGGKSELEIGDDNGPSSDDSGLAGAGGGNVGFGGAPGAGGAGGASDASAAMAATASSAATGGAAASVGTSVASSGTSGGGATLCDQACEKIEVTCGLGPVCRISDVLDCADPMASDCPSQCVLDAGCAAIASLAGPNPDPALALCIASC